MKPVLIVGISQQFWDALLASLASYGLWNNSRRCLTIMYVLIVVDFLVVQGCLTYHCKVGTPISDELMKAMYLDCSNSTNFEFLEISRLRSEVFIRDFVSFLNANDWSPGINWTFWLILVYLHIFELKNDDQKQLKKDQKTLKRRSSSKKLQG